LTFALISAYYVMISDCSIDSLPTGDQPEYSIAQQTGSVPDYALISQPVEKVEKNGREHIKYVPTQVLSEYFAKIYKKPDGNPLDGMVYYSAARNAGTNIVLFPPKQNKKGFMELVDFEGTEELIFQNWTEFCRKINQPSIETGAS
jgi:hypothetical protein